MDQEHAGIEKLPTLKVGWDSRSQRTVTQFDTDEYRNWDFVVAVLEMALSDAKFNQNMGRANMLQQQAMQQAQAQMIANELAKNGNGGIALR